LVLGWLELDFNTLVFCQIGSVVFIVLMESLKNALGSFQYSIVILIALDVLTPLMCASIVETGKRPEFSAVASSFGSWSSVGAQLTEYVMFRDSKDLKAAPQYLAEASELETTKTIGSIEADDYQKCGVSRDKLFWMLRRMIEIRRFEERVERLFLQEGALIGPSHLYLGQEAVAAGAIGALSDDDLIVTTYRGHGHAIAKGVPMQPLMAELFGKATGTCKGLGGSMHVAIYPEKGSLYATAIVGSGIPIAAGVGLGLQQAGKRQVVMTFFGDGASNTGAFHEGMNLAAVWKLPVIFVCENNLYAMSTRADQAVAAESVASRAEAYRMRSIVADGNDAVSVFLAGREAIDNARSGQGPTLVECMTYKLKGHGVYDRAEYRPKEEIERWLKRDPINGLGAKLLKAKLATQADFDQIENQVKAEVEESVVFAKASPILPFQDLMQYVYAR